MVVFVGCCDVGFAGQISSFFMRLKMVVQQRLTVVQQGLTVVQQRLMIVQQRLTVVQQS